MLLPQKNEENSKKIGKKFLVSETFHIFASNNVKTGEE